ncbi:hypothetical protein C8R45DRAFT_1167428 [Mycena sanguinolenta]|nr:hypothetical protein C8R45DRAFT_1167428 [Mycena sanguinolenta]
MTGTIVAPARRFSTSFYTRGRATDDSLPPPELPEKSSEKRPSRASKTAANKNAVWQGAAPVGPKPKDPNTTGRKRSASNQQESVKLKARKTSVEDTPSDFQDTEMAETPVAHVMKTKKPFRTEVISDSEETPAPQAPQPRKSRQLDPTQDPAELWDHDDADSDKSDRSNHEEVNDFEVEDGEDLEHVPADVLSQRFAQEARWQDGNDDDVEADVDDDFPAHERPSSRASRSSGYMSVPASDHASDSDEADSDAEASATFAALSKAAQRVPPVDQSRGKSAKNSLPVDAPTSLPLKKERGKRDIARDIEKPQFMDTAISTKPHARGKLRDTSSIPKVKREPDELAVHRQHVKKEHQSSSDIISISDSDDDTVPVINASSIQIVFRPDGKVTLKSQHSRVERTVQLGIDFYLGYYLFKLAFPGTEQKNAFALDALLNSAYNLELLDVMEKIRADTMYRNFLTPLLHGRVSSFRLKVKNASDATITGNYALQGNMEARISFLITAMRYIYPLSPGPVDLRTGKRGDDVVDTTKPYMTAGIHSTLLIAFFKGSPSVASKYSELFETNKDGRKELPASMVALGGTAVHSSLNEHRSGHHVQSKFEGNAVQEIYDTHILVLDKLRAKGSTVLADLYDVMVAESRLGSVAAKPMAMEALALLNL